MTEQLAALRLVLWLAGGGAAGLALAFAFSWRAYQRAERALDVIAAYKTEAAEKYASQSWLHATEKSLSADIDNLTRTINKLIAAVNELKGRMDRP